MQQQGIYLGRNELEIVYLSLQVKACRESTIEHQLGLGWNVHALCRMRSVRKKPIIDIGWMGERGMPSLIGRTTANNRA